MALGGMEMEVEFRYDDVVGAVCEVMIERKEENSDDNSLEVSKMEVSLCPACVAENLVWYFFINYHLQ